MALTGLPAISAPMPWQGQAWARFNQQFSDASLPHALLLGGVAHSGKARLALALARLLLCQAPSGGLNCGKCHACELSASGGHGDFRWLQPEEKSRNIKIDQVREVVAFATKTASFGERKVVVLAPAEAMNSNAANALLKSLEEPASGTFLILVCSQLHGVPATIRSRCQRVTLPAPSEVQSLEWLDKLTGERAQSQRLLAIAEGMPLLAESMFRRADGEALMAARGACRGLLEGKISTAKAQEMLAGGELGESLELIGAEVRAQIRRAGGGELASARGRALFALLDELTGLQRAVAGGANPNRQLITEVLLEKLQSVLGEASSGGSIRPSTGGIKP